MQGERKKGEIGKADCPSSTMQWMGGWIIVYVPEANFMPEGKEKGNE